VSEVEALQTTLAAEHAAVYVYGALGAQTSQSAQPVVFAAVSEAYAVHRDRRDQLVTDLLALGAVPAVAEPAYELPADLGTVEAVTARAVELEESCAATYAFVVASATGARRRWAVTALADAAVRAVGLGGSPDVLPGT
jgi:hypothetical protein